MLIMELYMEDIIISIPLEIFLGDSYNLYIFVYVCVCLYFTTNSNFFFQQYTQLSQHISYTYNKSIYYLIDSKEKF